MESNKIEFDYSKLKGRIVEKFGSVSAFEKRIKKSHTFVYNVFANKSYLTNSDIDVWADLLDIDSPNIGSYFLCRKS